MLRLIKYLRAYLAECILAPLFKMLEASFELIIPLVVKAVVDNGITSGDKSYIIRMSLIMVLLGLVGFISTAVAQYFAAKAATGFAAALKSRLFRHIQSLSYSEIDTLGASAIITRLTSDVNQIQNGVNLLLRLFLRSPFIVLGAMIFAFSIDVKSATVFAVVIPVLSAVIFTIMLISIPLYKKVQKLLDRVLGITRENLYGVRVIRAFCKEESENERFAAANSELTGMQKFVGGISALMNPVTYVIINLAVIALLKVSGGQVYAGNLTQGDTVALYNYMSQILVELIKLANLIVALTKCFASGARVSQTFDIVSSQAYPEATFGAKENNDAVTFENVSFTYKNASAPSLSNLSFSAKSGETVGIIGGTGSGKSSLVSLIPRFYDASEGRILIGGIPVQNYSKRELREKIGFVPQKAMLFQGTVAENLRWGKDNATIEEMDIAVQAAQAADVVASKDAGLDEKVSQGGGNFSGGQKQRLTIARALIKRPQILILDDSASALDYATDAALRRSINQIKSGDASNPTVFIVSQRASSVLNADKIVVLDDGEAVGIGKHSELLNTCPVYREIYESQFDAKEAGAE